MAREYTAGSREKTAVRRVRSIFFEHVWFLGFAVSKAVRGGVCLTHKVWRRGWSARDGGVGALSYACSYSYAYSVRPVRE